MLKAVVFLKKREDLTREQFIDYYENHHAPLIRRLLPSIAEYRRNYFDLSRGTRLDEDRQIGFDVLTEIWFEDRKAWEDFLAATSDPQIIQQIAEDEQNFIDRTKNLCIGVDEYRFASGAVESERLTA